MNGRLRVSHVTGPAICQVQFGWARFKGSVLDVRAAVTYLSHVQSLGTEVNISIYTYVTCP